MKKILSYIVALLLIANFAQAQQIDRSKAPKPGKAPKIELQKPANFTLPNGLRVYVVQNNKLPRVAFSLILERDPILEGEKAGYIEAVGQMMTAGTKNRTKEQLDKEVDFIGANLNASASSIFASSLKKHTPTLLALMSDVLLNPSFPAEELEKIKTQQISNLKSSEDNADAIASNVASVLRYGKTHPYGELSSEKSIKSVSVEDCRQYYNTYFKPNIGYLVIVGDITLKEARSLVTQYFGSWQKGEVPSKSYAVPQLPAQSQVALVEKTGAVQTVLSITHPIEFKISNPDYIAALLMNQVLGSAGSRLYRNLREDKGYTYGAYSSISQDRLVGSFSASASVRTAVTDSAVTEFLYELRRIRTEKVEEAELRRAKAVMAGNFARALESPATIANYALNIARYNLPADFYSTYLQKLEAVTADDILAVAQKYIQPDKAYILAVGDTKALQEKLKKFGKVKKYTIYGDEDKGIDPALLKDMSVEKVMKRYVEAVGGEQKLRTVKSLQQNMSMTIQGMNIDITSSQKSPDKFLMVQSAPMGEMMRQVLNGNKAAAISPQGRQTLTGDELEAMKEQATIFPELEYKNLKNTSYTLGEVKIIEDRPAYEIIATDKQGNKSMFYYDVETGLRVALYNPQMNLVYKNYQEVEGIKFPMGADISLMGMKVDAKIQTTVNPKLDDALFKVE